MQQNRQIKHPMICNLVTHVDGNWNNGLNTGPLYWNLNNSSANVNQNIGTHSLCALKCCEFYLPWLLPKHKPNPNGLVAVGRTLIRCKG